MSEKLSEEAPEDPAYNKEVFEVGAIPKGTHHPCELPDVVFYKSPLAVLPAILVWVAFTGLFAYLTLRYPITIEYLSLFESESFEVSVPIPLLALPPLVHAMYIFHSLYDQRYVISQDHVRCVQGLVSLSKHDFRVDYQDIRGVEIDRSLYGRIVNVGTLAIGSASKADIEIHLDGIFNPSRYRDIIAKRRKFYTVDIMKESLEPPSD